MYMNYSVYFHNSYTAYLDRKCFVNKVEDIRKEHTASPPPRAYIVVEIFSIGVD
jgi:hypothetical protein